MTVTVGAAGGKRHKLTETRPTAGLDASFFGLRKVKVRNGLRSLSEGSDLSNADWGQRKRRERKHSTLTSPATAAAGAALDVVVSEVAAADAAVAVVASMLVCGTQE